MCSTILDEHTSESQMRNIVGLRSICGEPNTVKFNYSIAVGSKNQIYLSYIHMYFNAVSEMISYYL